MKSETGLWGKSDSKQRAQEQRRRYIMWTERSITETREAELSFQQSNSFNRLRGRNKEGRGTNRGEKKQLVNVARDETTERFSSPLLELKSPSIRAG